MNNLYTMTIQDCSAPEDVQFVNQGLCDYNRGHVGDDNHLLLNIFWRDPENRIVAGLLGGTFWGWLHVDVLWVDEELRGRGLGRALLEAAEREAVARGCRYSHLETHSFQSLGFYEKQGYVTYGELPDFPAGHVKYFMKKALQAAPSP